MIALGMYMSRFLLTTQHFDMHKGTNRFLLLLFPVSALYVFLGGFIAQPFPLFRPEWGIQNLLLTPYTFVLTSLLLNLGLILSLRNISKGVKFACAAISKISKASYHIFLVQILFFGFGFSFTNILVPYGALIAQSVGALGNIACTVLLGILFYLFQQKLAPTFRVNHWPSLFQQRPAINQ
jgi:hypothetical protein